MSDLFRFSVFELDVRTGELRKSGARVRLSGQPLKLLERLIARPGELVTRDELQRELWSDDTFVDFERNLNTTIKRLRATLGDSADVPRFIETLPRRGYRFLAPVERVLESRPSVDRIIEEDAESGLEPLADKDAATTRRLALWPAAATTVALILAAALVYAAWPERPRGFRTIAVLPFVLADADSSAEYLAFGLAEALSKELSRFDRLRVISQTTSQRYKDVGKTLPQIAEELGVDVVVEGSVQREGSRMRITVQLIEAAGDTHLWAESYEREIGSALVLADEVARAVATEIHVQVTPAVDAERTTAGRPVDPAVAEAYLKGRYTLGEVRTRISTARRATSNRPWRSIHCMRRRTPGWLTTSSSTTRSNPGRPSGRPGFMRSRLSSSTRRCRTRTRRWRSFGITTSGIGPERSGSLPARSNSTLGMPEHVAGTGCSCQRWDDIPRRSIRCCARRRSIRLRS